MRNEEATSLSDHYPVNRVVASTSLKHMKSVFTIDFVCGTLLVFITLLIIVQVFLRYVMSYSFVWSDEVIRFTFTWLGFLSASLAMKYKGHIAIDALVNALPNKFRNTFETCIELVVLGLVVLLTIVGFKMMLITHGQSAVSLNLPLSVVYASLPVSTFLMTIYTLKHLNSRWKKR